MPFKSKSQMRACFAKNDPNWDCHKWAHETPNRKKLPERMKKMMGGKMRMPCHKCGGEMQPGGIFLPQQDPNLMQMAIPETDNFQVPYSPDPLQNAISKGLIAPPQGFSSSQQAYDYYNTPAPQKKKRKPFDPIWKYDELKALQNGLALWSGSMERGRQNQYIANQMSTLGQIDPLPVSNFQPNPYNLYARLGGSLRRYQKGGQNAPIYTDNPNDPRLRAYRDSLQLSQKFPFVKGNSQTKQEAINSYNKESWDSYIQDIKAGRFGTEGLPNLNKGIYPIGVNTYEGMGDWHNPVFKKPIQPIVYQERPKHPYTKSVAEPGLPEVHNEFGAPVPSNIGGPQGKSNYAFQYRDENGQQQVVYFPNSTEMAKFAKDQPWTSKSGTSDSWTISAPYLKRKRGGWIKKAVNPEHKGWCTPLSNPHCTGHRRAFALMMKKKHGFHKGK